MEGPPMTEEDRIAKPSLASDEVVQEEEGEIDEQSGSQSNNESVNSTVIRVEERLETQNNRTRSESSTMKKQINLSWWRTKW
jgi:hypothetical protein